MNEVPIPSVKQNEIIISLGGNSFSNVRIFFWGTPEEALTEANRLYKLQAGGPGLEQKEWNGVFDRYMAGKGMTEDEMTRMNSYQSAVIKEIDRSRNRKPITGGVIRNN